MNIYENDLIVTTSSELFNELARMHYDKHHIVARFALRCETWLKLWTARNHGYPEQYAVREILAATESILHVIEVRTLRLQKKRGIR